MWNTTETEIINDTYQVAECIRQTPTASYYYGFHLRMKKEILIIISQEPLRYSIPNTNELPYLPYIIDKWLDWDRCYTVLSYARGIFFEDYIKQKREFTERELISLGLQICDILKEFEQRNILAAEIWKPDNVMLTPDFRICFFDGSSLVRKTSAADVSGENLKAAAAFMRILSQGSKTKFSKAVDRDFKKVPKFRKRLLNIIKRLPAYKKMKWKQRILYAVLVCIFIGNAAAFYKNAVLYREDSLMSAGNSAFQNGEYEQAIIDYQNVLLMNPDNITARRGIAESYWNEGNIEKAEQSFLENVSDYQDETGAVYLIQIREDKALDSFTAGNYEKALEYYLELEAGNPNPKYEEMLFNIYLMQNDFENTKNLIQQLRSQEIDEDLTALLNETDQMIKRSEEAGGELRSLADLIVQEDWQALSNRLRTADFVRLCEEYGGDTYCRYEGDIFIKVYKTGSVYLGEMEHDQRSGQGKLVRLSTEYLNLIVFSGEWSNDLPNGPGVQEAVIVPYLKEGRQIWLSMAGNYVNGYSDGELFVREYELVDTEKKVFRSVTFKSDMGYLEPLKEYEDIGDVIGIWDTGELQFSRHYNHIESVAGLGLSECYFQYYREID